MPRPAYVLMNNTGVVERTHSTDVGNNNVVTAGVSDLEQLIQQGYQPLREIPLDGGKVLIVLQKP